MSIELQRFLFDAAPSRRQLLQYVPQEQKQYRVQVFRNHSFELVEHTIGAYLDYAGLGVTFSYGGYDDSLSFLELDPSADMLLLWIDTSRYDIASVKVFFEARIRQLRLQFSKPVLVVPVGNTLDLQLAGVAVLNLSEIQSALGERFLDERAEKISGTRLSSKAMLEISRELGARYLPVLLRPALKAVVVDLDNTLYQGVLGEDGPDGLVLSEGHRMLQEKLHQLAEEGFFVCAASKNEAEDVEKLFSVRTDFPLKRNDFSKIFASWESKADSIRQIADFLNIDPESMVFLDDNIGELTAVKMSFPRIKIILAEEDGAATCRALENYPGLLKLNVSADDAKRKDDIRANEERKILQEKLTPEEYIRSLGIHLQFSYDVQEQVGRIAELANKTNQFIFNYQRYTASQVEARMRSDRYAVVAVSLSDKLSDSGLIGVCVGCRKERQVELEECFISCRALGRGIDEIIVLGAIQGILDRMGTEYLRVAFRSGERNLPAQNFVQRHLAQYLEQPHYFHYEMPKDLVTLEIL